MILCPYSDTSGSEDENGRIATKPKVIVLNNILLSIPAV